MIRSVGFTALLHLALVVSATAQSVPDLVNYQGTLLRPDGTAEVGPKTLEFRVVNEANTVVWGPQTFEDLPLQQGKFNVLLGSDDAGTTIASVFAGGGEAARYLSVTVAGESSERLPLQRIAAVPFAVRSGTSDDVRDGSITTPKLEDGSVTKAKLQPIPGQSGFAYSVIDGVGEASSDHLHRRPISGDTLFPNSRVNLNVSGTGRPIAFFLASPEGFSTPYGDVVLPGSTAMGALEARTSWGGVYKISTRFCNDECPAPPASAFHFILLPPVGETEIWAELHSSGSAIGLAEGLRVYAIEY